MVEQAQAVHKVWKFDLKSFIHEKGWKSYSTAISQMDLHLLKITKRGRIQGKIHCFFCFLLKWRWNLIKKFKHKLREEQKKNKKRFKENPNVFVFINL